MIDYREPLNGILPHLSREKAPEYFREEVGPLLVAMWAQDYASNAPRCELLETSDAGFSYLFDVTAERLVAAWGISRGKNQESRAVIATRMKGHPLNNSGRYHRGHAIAHTLGGRTDINLVPQLGKINSGPFRALEAKAVSCPGALYFTYWRYSVGDGQVPIGVEQGLLCPGEPACAFELKTFGN
ncbi:DNA/RNA non-specific endonuclease [Paraburkholderia oxyphila]|uniref:DNA/RNA non-specific endonuclease n=1 Tax=Paraburkholderia oxyphila TaxID=614212 RepID=UPI000488949F|nr:DNA/RNA non-specific endonuclease [Paraburkholderia oxyphila]